ncbi:hypothetical protein Tco_0377087 [Tanacetum coccineum]
MAAFLEKSTGSKGFHQVIDFLSQSHISYALTKKPEIYISFIKQFWRTAEASTDADREVTITAIIDGQSKTITEASLRRHLKVYSQDWESKEESKVVLSEDEEGDSSKQGRIDEDPNTYFAQDDEVVHDQDTAATRHLEDSTAGITVSTAPINISTARES